MNKTMDKATHNKLLRQAGLESEQETEISGNDRQADKASTDTGKRKFINRIIPAGRITY